MSKHRLKSPLKSFISVFSGPASPPSAGLSSSSAGNGRIPPVQPTEDLVLSNMATASRITRDAAEALDRIPYVKAITGVLAQILKIYEVSTLWTVFWKCEEITSMVEKYTITIIECLAMLYASEGEYRLETLKFDLQAFQKFLITILTTYLEPLKAQNKSSAYVKRDRDAEDMRRIERELSGFVNRFTMKGVVAANVGRSTSTPAEPPPQPIIPQVIPLPPSLVIGRDSIIASTAETLATSKSPRVALLGAAGIGKTTVALRLLHDSGVLSSYPVQYFISCEDTPTRALLEARIAAVVGIPPEQLGQDPASTIVHKLRERGDRILICLDNLETVWEVPEERPKLNILLDILSTLQEQLAVLVTIRGVQAPHTSFAWNKCQLPELDSESSAALYQSISGIAPDSTATTMLQNLSGIPLAIKLFARMVDEGDSPARLLTQWDRLGSSSIETGGIDKLSNLDKSIHLSVFSPRVRDSERVVLALLAVLTVGLSQEPMWYNAFITSLPEGSPNLDVLLRNLRRVALVEERDVPARWKMLPPIREFCRRSLETPSNTLPLLIEAYLNEYAKFYRKWPSNYITYQLEHPNIRSLLSEVIHRRSFPLSALDAAGAYGVISSRHGVYDVALLEELVAILKDPRDQGQLRLIIGTVLSTKEDPTGALASYEQAQKAFRKAGKYGDQADARRAIGDIQMRNNQLNEAAESYKFALKIFVRVRSVRGQAVTFRSLGQLHALRGSLDVAMKYLEDAIAKYIEMGSQIGQANTLDSIAAVQIDRGEVAEAELTYDRARELYITVGDYLGHSNTLRAIAKLQKKRGDLDSAMASYESGLKVFRDEGHLVRQGQILMDIGDTQIFRGEIDEALAAMYNGLDLFVRAGHRLYEATAIFTIGMVYFNYTSELEKARSYLIDAARMYSAIGETGDMAEKCLLLLGKIWVADGVLEQMDQENIPVLRAQFEMSRTTEG
ncbi:hypothetical protein DL96DRAFT_1714780 [Flagelloscypha sp. PMI_526]|nr:hypothetical protein DL96DRAFT_1714780 [Flagelloscypha sp. PMI_526]